MKSSVKVIALMAAIVAGGCDKQEEPAKLEGAAVFKAQQEALDKAKQVEGVIQDASDRQRGLIDEQSR